ncbi:Hypothetical predicted protein, partial [Marmota monax]
ACKFSPWEISNKARSVSWLLCTFRGRLYLTELQNRHTRAERAREPAREGGREGKERRGEGWGRE